MRVLVDTSILVEIDRHNPRVVDLLKTLSEQQTELLISTTTVAEILTGPYLRKDSQKSLEKARDVLNQFEWVDLDGDVAAILARLLAQVCLDSREIDYPDIIIAASAIHNSCDALLTLNKKDFVFFSQLKDITYTPDEFPLQSRS
ncbi:MAG TPA: PIN domain-containing protein [Candidatus Hodarchaeales archaeon]|nr:PIN domain-containing protein [Candidatus Hodarchaeales archaeon]HLC84263.1 PIN domain-containing protein [Candidatus Nanoarchaeia archaeon]